MTKLRRFLTVEASALLSLLIVAAAMAAYGAIDSMGHANSLLDPAASAQIGFGYTLVVGILPVVLFGAPCYLALLHKHLARWPYVLGVGVLPGFILLPLDLTFGFWGILCGAAFALLTHIMCRGLGPNNSFKSNPLRGLA